MAKLKILQVLECGGPGGTGNQVAALCAGLDPERFEVGLVYAVREGAPEDFARLAGVKTAHHVPELTREISPWRDLRAFLKLYGIFRREAPEAVHLHSSKAGFLGRLAAKAAGVPKIFYSPRGYGFLQQDRPAPARLLYRLLEGAVSWIGTIVAVSESEAALARSLSWGRAVEVVCDPYLGELAEQAPRAPGPLLVGACGRLTHARNPDAFVLLAQRLTDSRNGLRCVWIGDGEEGPTMRAHLENMNLGSKVEVTGWLPPQTARERLLGLDLFVHYSRWEGLPNAVLEAMAAGLAVVASDIPGNRDAVSAGSTGYLVKNEIELLERCLELIDDPDKRRRFGLAGRTRVSRYFSREQALASLSELYRGS